MTKQKDGEDGKGGGDDKSIESVEPVQEADEDEIGDHRHVERDHQRRQVDEEERFSAAEA